MYRLSFFSIFLTISILFTSSVLAGDIIINETDSGDRRLFGFFDLRDRETFIQITNTDPEGQQIHIQLFNVADNCNENNFFDTYTPNDTHQYNLRDIVTNDGSPSGVVLPNDAYGIFVAKNTLFPDSPPLTLIGNLRILDNNGYEYRTNLIGTFGEFELSNDLPFTFNFNTFGGVSLSDVVGFALDNTRNSLDATAADVVNIWVSFDINIFNNNENIFSCRDVTFACVNQNHPLLEALLEESETSVASFEYGINNAIPHSKGGELLCPGNTIPEGFVTLNFLDDGNELDSSNPYFIFVGLNNGNGRGSLDSIWNAGGNL